MVIKPGDPRPEIWIYGNSGHGGDKQQFADYAPWSAPELAPVTVIIPTISPRIHLLNRALKSVQIQDLMPHRIIVQVDHQGEGAAITRNKALQKVPEDSKAVEFLDDDDYFLRWHTRLHWAAMLDQQADYVYAHWQMGGLTFDPFPAWWRTTPWSNDRPHQTTIVTMVRRELAREVGFRPVEVGKWPPATEEGHTFGEDYQFTLECLEKGAKIYHILNERTWTWVATGNSTQGLAKNWKVDLSVDPRFWIEQREK